MYLSVGRVNTLGQGPLKGKGRRHVHIKHKWRGGLFCFLFILASDKSLLLLVVCLLWAYSGRYCGHL